MFNKTTIYNTTPKIDIHEYRAPTDESVRLLKEFEEKALEKLYSTTRLENNTFNVVWHVFREYITLENKVVCRYKLNDIEYKFEFAIDSMYNSKKISEQVIEKVKNAVAEHLLIDLAGSKEFINLMK